MKNRLNRGFIPLVLPCRPLREHGTSESSDRNRRKSAQVLNLTSLYGFQTALLLPVVNLLCEQKLGKHKGFHGKASVKSRLYLSHSRTNFESMVTPASFTRVSMTSRTPGGRSNVYAWLYPISRLENWSCWISRFNERAADELSPAGRCSETCRSPQASCSNFQLRP